MTGTPHGAFVLSSGRCGSTLLSNMLAQHPKVLSLSEWFSMLDGPATLSERAVAGGDLQRLLAALPSDLRQTLELASFDELLMTPAKAQLREVSPLRLIAAPHLSPQRPDALVDAVLAQASRQPHQSLARHFHQLFEWLAERGERQCWVERSGGSIEYSGHLTAAFPGARIVYLVRDGRDCALSMSRHPMFRIRLARILARDPALAVAACLAREVPLDRFGAYWSSLMQRTLRELQAAPPRTRLVLRFEQLLNDPEAELRRLAQFLGVSSERWVDAASALVRHTAPRWTALEASERRKLERMCKPGLRLLEPMATLSA